MGWFLPARFADPVVQVPPGVLVYVEVTYRPSLLPRMHLRCAVLAGAGVANMVGAPLTREVQAGVWCSPATAWCRKIERPALRRPLHSCLCGFLATHASG